jgi:predicted branched-subunit amino acid permease
MITSSAFWQGVRATFSFTPGVFSFAFVFGAYAASKGLSLLETLSMSFFVYAGLSSMMGLQQWQEVWTFGGLIAVAIVVFAVNLRMVLMGAYLHPHLSQLKPYQSYLALLTLTDANFISTTGYIKDGGNDVGFFIGSGVYLLVLWVALTLPGFYFGSLLGDIKRFGLDLFLPLFFGAMSVKLWFWKRDVFVWTIAALVSLTASHLIDGYWFIVIGALVASICGGLLRKVYQDAE